MKARIILIVIFLLLTKPVYCQKYELYTGSVISEDSNMHPGYMIGLNRIFEMHQKDDKYLTKLLVGFEHSAFMSGNKTFSKTSDNQILPPPACNCETDNIDFSKSSQYTLKKEVRAVSLNFGLEFCNDCWLKRLYLLTGVTNYQHISKINNEKVEEYRTMQIDAGLKYFIKINNSYLSPTFKFNPETISFGIGFSK